MHLGRTWKTKGRSAENLVASATEWASDRDRLEAGQKSRSPGSTPDQPYQDGGLGPDTRSELSRWSFYACLSLRTTCYKQGSGPQTAFSGLTTGQR